MHINPEQLEQYGSRSTAIAQRITWDFGSLSKQCPLDNGRHALEPIQHDLGHLSVLPVELFTGIMQSLTVSTLTKFRQVSRAAMAAVDSLHGYCLLAKHFPDILRAILSLEADSFDCGTLWRTLTTSTCASCHGFGNYLYIITCERVRYKCFSFDTRFLPVMRSRKMQEEENTPRIPNVLSLPGRRARSGYASPRARLFDRKSYFNAGGPSSLKGAALDDNPLSRFRDSWRYAAIIAAPVFNPASDQVADWGFYCNLCEEGRFVLENSHFTRKYTTDQFAHHVQADHGVVV